MNKIIVLAIFLGNFLLIAPGYASEDLAKAKGCLACHSIDQKKLGPSYKDVAGKYAGVADAGEKLAAKIISGGAGSWGNIPMPPNPSLSQEDAKKLAQWVLGLK